jgi:hypothetical protein
MKIKTIDRLMCLLALFCFGLIIFSAVYIGRVVEHGGLKAVVHELWERRETNGH